MIFSSNGFIVESSIREFEGIKYYGTDNNPWPFDVATVEDYPAEYVNEWNSKEQESCFDGKGVFLLSEAFSLHYVRECISRNVNSYILYCEANTNIPSYNESWANKYRMDKNFMGYDYAYPGGTYYSCIFNDLSRLDLFPEMYRKSLNEYGLFGDINLLYDFIEKRSERKKDMPYLTFEEGDFYIYKIYSDKI